MGKAFEGVEVDLQKSVLEHGSDHLAALGER